MNMEALSQSLNRASVQDITSDVGAASATIRDGARRTSRGAGRDCRASHDGHHDVRARAHGRVHPGPEAGRKLPRYV